MPVPHCFMYCNLVGSLEVRWYELSSIGLFSALFWLKQDNLARLSFYMSVKISIPVSSKVSWDGYCLQ